MNQSDYDLCDQENSNLRRCLAWAGKLLTHEQRLELAKMIKGPIVEGGVVLDDHEAQMEEYQQFKRDCVEAANMLRVVIETTKLETLEKNNWFGRAEALATRLMSYDPPADESLLSIRNEK